MGKYGRRLQSIMRTLKYVDLMSLRKGILGYLTSFTNTCFFVCLFFACLSAFLFYRELHCKRIEIRSLCHTHQACRKFFFYLQGVGGGVRSNDETDQTCARGALGESEGECPMGNLET